MTSPYTLMAPPPVLSVWVELRWKNTSPPTMTDWPPKLATWPALPKVSAPPAVEMPLLSMYTMPSPLVSVSAHNWLFMAALVAVMLALAPNRMCRPASTVRLVAALALLVTAPLNNTSVLVALRVMAPAAVKLCWRSTCPP